MHKIFSSEKKKINKKTEGSSKREEHFSTTNSLLGARNYNIIKTERSEQNKKKLW